MKKHFLILPMLLLFSTQLFSQKLDYLKLKRNLKLITCTRMDSATVLGTYNFLNSLDSNKIAKNKFWYFYDFGMCYYTMYLASKKNADLQLSITKLKSALKINSKSTSVFWNLSFDYSLLGECEKSADALAKYLRYAIKEEIDTTQVGWLKKRCLNK